MRDERLIDEAIHYALKDVHCIFHVLKDNHANDFVNYNDELLTKFLSLSVDIWKEVQRGLRS